MNKSTKNTEKMILEGLIELFGQCRRWLLFFGTGTSCALDKRFGMSALTYHLKVELDGAADWHKIHDNLESGQTLEQALTGVGLSDETKLSIQKSIGAYIAKIDHEVRDDVLLGKSVWVGENLVKSLVDRLPPRNPRLPIVTANYDMLIEYACARQGIRYTSGFSGEIVRKWNWEEAQDSLNRCRYIQKGIKSMVQMDPIPRVELFKVHGSINRFSCASTHRQIECDIWGETIPSDLEHIIAVPGDQKYEQYASIVETAALASRAENDALAFAMIGYGFNDPHLHEQIFGRIRSQDSPLLVLTLELADDRINEIRDLGKRTWILVATKSTSGETDESHTLVYSPDLDAPVVLNNERLWSCDCFAQRILGG